MLGLHRVEGGLGVEEVLGEVLGGHPSTVCLFEFGRRMPHRTIA